MKDAVRALVGGTARATVEDAVGLIALFVLLFAMLALPGLP